MSPGQVILLLTMHDVEIMRAAAGLPSSLLCYFTNKSLNEHLELSTCMHSMAEKVRHHFHQEPVPDGLLLS